MHSTIRRLAAFALGLGIAIPSTLLSQDVPGRVTGRVTDERSGAPLSNVGVQIVGTGQGTMTREDGEFSVANVRPGTITIQFRRIGYQPKTVTGLMLEAGGLLSQDVVLVPATIQLETQRIVATARGSVNEALEKQKNAAGVQNSITQEEMSKTADGDAAQAVQRVSGVTVEGGRYVSVRGLNERYTTTSLNGARIPSPEPEKKVVPLDLFPSGLLQAVTTAKTFTPDLPGDFAGAAVDLQTREFPLTPVRTYSLSAGVNTSVVGKDMLSAPTTGGEWAALTGSSRSMPGPIAGAGRFTRSYSTSEMNALVGSFRNAWAAERKNGAPNVSASASIGGRDSVFGHGFGYIGSLTYSLSNEVRRDEYRARAVPSGPSGLIPVNAYRGETGRSSVLWGGLFNFSTLLGRTKLDFNNIYTRTADNDARVDSGTFTADQLDIQRTVLRYVERSALSSQLRLERAVGERQLLKGAFTGALVTRDEPDRSELTYGYELDPVTGARSGLRWQQAYSDAARRSFGTLDENDFSGTADYRIDLGNLDRPLSLKVGVYGRRTHRDADANAYSIFGSLDNAQRELSPEQIFDGRFAQGSSSLLTVAPNANTGAYAATDLVAAGYAMIEAQPLSRVRVAAGARAEQSQMQLATSSLGNLDVDTTYRHFDLLPSAVVTVELTPSQNLRLAASQTLARPEYRERAPMRYYDIIEDDLIVGNPALRQSVIRNADVRWEWYPASGELISVGAFAKRFDRPIERVYLASAGAQTLSFLNADGATNAGLEVEVRQSLGRLAEVLDPFSVSLNATWMRSRITVDTSTKSALTNHERPMYGQAPYVYNLGLSYASASGRFAATTVYNRVGKRVTAAGVNGTPDNYEMPRNALDLSLRFPIAGSLFGSFDAKNILDDRFESRSGPIVRERYFSGRVLSAGVSWKP